MGLFRGGENAARRPVASAPEGDDTTPRPLARHSALEPDRALFAPPPPAFQEPRLAETSFNPFSEPNTTGRNNRSRSLNESQFQHARTEEVIDLARGIGSSDSPRDEYAREIAELEERSNEKIDAMEERLARMTEDIWFVEESLRGVGNRIGRGLEA